MKSLKKKLVVITAMFIVAIMTAPVFAQKIPSGKTFIVQSMQEFGRSDKGCWDVPGDPKSPKKNQNLKLWQLYNQTSKWDRTFRFVHKYGNVYEIRANHYKKVSVDVNGGRFTGGNNISLYKSSPNHVNQKFRMKHLGNGRWKIYAMRNNMVVCADQRNTSNGGNVVIHRDHNGPWMEWALLDKYTRKPFVPSKGLGIKLAQACQSKGRSANRYFPKVRSAVFSNENRSQSMSSILNRHSGADRISLIQNIVKATAKNKDSLSRYYIYNELRNVNIPKGFLINVIKRKIKQDVKRRYKAERYSPAKSALKKLYKKL